MGRDLLHTCFFMMVMFNLLSPNVCNVYHQTQYELVLERATVLDYNNDLISKLNLRSFKYNRTNIALNLKVGIRIEIDVLQIKIRVYKMMSNEYRGFPIDLEVDLCRALRDNSFGIGDMVLKHGNVTQCPVLKGYYEVSNFALISASLPPNIPPGRYMLVLNFSAPDGRHMATVEYYARIKYF